MTVFYSTPHYTLTPLQIKGLKNSWILGENWWIHLINYRGVLQESEVNLTLGFEVLFEVYEPYFFNGCISTNHLRYGSFFDGTKRPTSISQMQPFLWH